MKELILVRHAKSDWSDETLVDFDRPLNKRGLKDAPFMAKLLKEKKLKPDLIITSPALRAFSTAQIFADKLKYKNDIKKDMNIYEASEETLFEIVSNLNDNYERVFLFGHNPGLQEFAEDISTLDEFNVPTCAVVHIEFDTKSWQEISKENSKLISYDYPKKFKKKGDE